MKCNAYPARREGEGKLECEEHEDGESDARWCQGNEKMGVSPFLILRINELARLIRATSVTPVRIHAGCDTQEHEAPRSFSRRSMRSWNKAPGTLQGPEKMEDYPLWDSTAMISFMALAR